MANVQKLKEGVNGERTKLKKLRIDKSAPTREQTVIIGRICGKASGEARRQKKAAKEAAILFASMPAFGENKELLNSLGAGYREKRVDKSNGQCSVA